MIKTLNQPFSSSVSKIDIFQFFKVYSIVYFILGYVVPDLSLSPLCHPQFKKGPPSEIAQVASNFLNQVLHNSGFINLEDLCILEGKFVWVLYIDLTCLNYGGNILDVSVKAMISALKNDKSFKKY